MNLTQIIAVMLGGAIGSLLRFCLVSWVADAFSAKDIPLGTLLVNVLGSFFIGVLACVFIEKITSDFLRVFFIIGLLGSFTTVSSFSLETVQLLMSAEYLKAGINIIATMTLCVCATWMGLVLTRQYIF